MCTLADLWRAEWRQQRDSSCRKHQTVLANDTPRAHHASERAAIRLGVAAGAVTEHDRGEWPAAARLQQDALEIDGRTVQRADERPRRPGRGLGIAGD
jgi:hypothetical protein